IQARRSRRGVVVGALGCRACAGPGRGRGRRCRIGNLGLARHADVSLHRAAPYGDTHDRIRAWKRLAARVDDELTKGVSDEDHRSYDVDPEPDIRLAGNAPAPR